VEIVQRVNGVTRLAIQTSKARPSTSELTSLLRQSNIAVTEFYMKRATLDDVFRQIASHGAEN